MRIHYFQHVPFEGPAVVGQWVRSKGHTFTATKFFQDSILPDIRDIDLLVILGGPMGVYDEEIYPWLAGEKAFIHDAVENGKTVVGICLGAQFIADVLGAKVYRGPHREIDWFPIELTREAVSTGIFGFLPERFTVFHWHGDTFDLPDGAVHLARSEGCENQAFLYNRRVLGLQFHLESTMESVRDIVRNCGHEIREDKYVQSGETMLSASPGDFSRINNMMFGILDRLPGTGGI